MPKANGTETFLEMRDRLMEVHGWCRRISTIAARYYLGVESLDELRSRTQSPDLSLAEAYEITKWR